MASKHTKIPRAVNEFKLFLDYNSDSYFDASKNIKPSEGWNIPYHSSEIYDIVGNLEGNLYEGIYPKLSKENPAADEEIINAFKGALTLFESHNWVFEAIIKKKKEKEGEGYLGLAEGIVHELLYKAILKLKEVLQLAEEDILRDKTKRSKVVKKTTEDTICIITATTEEFKTLQSKISNATPLPTDNDDSQIYQRGTINGKNGVKINVIFTQLHFQGIASASNTTTKMILAFKPKLVVMVGHAAGNKNLKRDLFIGDILICKEAIDYDSVILIDRGDANEPTIEVKEKPNPFKADSTLIQSLKNYALVTQNLQQIKRTSRHQDKMTHDLKFKDGKLISGDALVRSATWFQRVTRDNHEAIGLDMETFGVYYSAENTLKENKPLFVSIKSVSDFGENSNILPEAIRDQKIRVEYAIDTSINFFLNYAENNLPL
ncbi:MAG: hypothetical protein Q7T12_00585 [Flavobacterium sp.]|nr:hypothetical protein [Flavobacterium sp.]